MTLRCECGNIVVEYIEATTGEVVAWWCNDCKKRRSREEVTGHIKGHPGINCICDDCAKAKAEYARRLRSQRRKMEVEDRERDRVLGTERAKLDNKFLADCGIEAVTFDKGRIVPWRGLLCEDNKKRRGQSSILLET